MDSLTELYQYASRALQVIAYHPPSLPQLFRENELSPGCTVDSVDRLWTPHSHMSYSHMVYTVLSHGSYRPVYPPGGTRIICQCRCS